MQQSPADATGFDGSRREFMTWLAAVSAAAVGGASPFGATTAWAEEPPTDARSAPLKDYDGYFPWKPSDSAAEWAVRAEFVRRRILVATGLWPMPARPELKPNVHGRIERDDYSVEKVVIESFPGMYLTGLLYRPKGQAGRAPAILNPHGHWPNGRYFNHSDDALKKEISSGAESDPVGGRNPLETRCISLARQGYVVFFYDMLGYADSAPLSQALTHGFGKQRPELSSPDRWGLFSAQSELRLINAFGLQTWNSVRALDWLLTLPDVDAKRIGVTGASGGGTQTMILTAIDDRVAAGFPAVMVSTAMQGGCTCENASLLRVDTGNIEFAALAAPRPYAMTGAQDWTVDLETKGLPELKSHYAMLGAPDKIDGKFFPFPHNYNQPARSMMYRFFNKWLKSSTAEYQETTYVPLTKEEAYVWTDALPKPADTVEAELSIVRAWDAEFRRQMDALVPRDAAGLDAYRRTVGGAWDVMIGRPMPKAVVGKERSTTQVGKFQRIDGWVENTAYKEVVFGRVWQPAENPRRAVLWVSAAGSTRFGETEAELPQELQLLASKGVALAACDVFGSGRPDAAGLLVESPKVKNPREFFGYTAGYNHTVFAKRVHDVLACIAFLKSEGMTVDLVGEGPGATWAAAAAAIAGDAVARLVVQTDGYRFATIESIGDVQLIPGAVKYGDLPGLLALSAPRPLRIAGERADGLAVVQAAYKAAGSENLLAIDDAAQPEQFLRRTLRWLQN